MTEYNLGHVKGADGVGISNISYSVDEDTGDTTVTVSLSNEGTKTFLVKRGEQGAQGVQGDAGVGVADVVLHETSGLTKIYHMIMTDGTVYEFAIADGVGSEYAPVDVVEEDNMKPVTSNAVYEYIEEYIGAYEEDMSS